MQGICYQRETINPPELTGTSHSKEIKEFSVMTLQKDQIYVYFLLLYEWINFFFFQIMCYIVSVIALNKHAITSPIWRNSAWNCSRSSVWMNCIFSSSFFASLFSLDQDTSRGYSYPDVGQQPPQSRRPTPIREVSGSTAHCSLALKSTGSGIAYPRKQKLKKKNSRTTGHTQSHQHVIFGLKSSFYNLIKCNLLDKLWTE